MESLKSSMSIPFYSLNDKLDTDEMTRQILFMKEKGMGGFFLHARGGLRTEYMSDEWFNAMEAAILVAEREGMDVWFYDENGWPSGFANGECLLPEFYISYLTMQKKDSFDESAYAVFAGQDNDLVRVTEAGEYTEFYCVYRNYNPFYVDLLNPALTDKFIEVCHEKYYARFAKYFGNVVKGFFTDEPQYSTAGYPISSVSEKEFEKAYGYSMKDNVISLFVETPNCYAFRYDYRALTNRLFMENYTKKLYDWCTAHNCMLTGHTIDETTLFGQMRWNGGAMRFYEFEHIPGIDHLSRDIESEVPFKQLSSVAEQLGKKHCITETFGASGHYSEPKDFKFIADMQYVAGVNLVCQHLFPYSVRGIRKRDWPPYFSHHTSWNTASETFYDRLTKIGWVLSNYPEKIETLLLHPIESCFLDFSLMDGSPCHNRQANFEATVREVVRHQLPHHFGDEVIMRKYGKVENGVIKIGDYEYKNVIITDQINISKSTHEMLTEYVRQGGKIFVERDDFPLYVDGRPCADKIKSNITLDEIFATSPVKVKEGCSDIRSRRCGDYFYTVNANKTAPTYSTYIIDGARSVCEWDPVTDKETAVDYKIEDGKLVFSVALDPRQSVVYKFNSEKTPDLRVKAGTTINIRDRIEIKGVEKNYLLIDKFLYSFDGEVYFGPKAIYDIANELMRERFVGDFYLKKYFLYDSQKGSELLIEENDSAEVYLNGAKIEKSYKEDVFDVYNLDGNLIWGDNVLIVKMHHYQSDYVYEVLYGGALETLKNNLVLDTELENMFIRGDFAVRRGSEIKCDRFNEFADDLWISTSYDYDKTNVTKNSYPFIKDKFVAELGLEIKETDYSISVDHSFDALRMIVNGQTFDLINEDKADISSALKEGANKIVFEFFPTSQLFYGPHRRDDISNPVCSPSCFGYEAVSGRTIKMVEHIYTKKQGINGIYLIKNVR